MNSKAFGVVAGILAQVLWGFSFMFTKAGTDVAPPFVFLAWRFAVAAGFIGLLVALRVVKIDLRGKPVGKLLGVSLLVPVLYYTGETLGVVLTTTAESGTIIGMAPAMTILASWLVMKERPRRLEVVGIALAIIGVIITVIAKGVSASFNPVGYFVLFASITAFAFYTVFSRQLTEFTEWEKTFVMLVVGGLAFAMLGLGQAIGEGTVREAAMLPFENSEFMASILFLGIFASVASYFLTNASLARIGSIRYSSFIGLSTVVTIVAAVLFVGEDLLIGQIVGVAVILIGVQLANLQSDDAGRSGSARNGQGDSSSGIEMATPPARMQRESARKPAPAPSRK